MNDLGDRVEVNHLREIGFERADHEDVVDTELEPVGRREVRQGRPGLVDLENIIDRHLDEAVLAGRRFDLPRKLDLFVAWVSGRA